MSTVYVSGQGDCYHSRQDCPALLRGQQGAAAQGQELRRIVPMGLSKAVAAGKDECDECWRT
jgi:hypothetical protein